jgi:hypothetical protein
MVFSKAKLLLKKIFVTIKNVTTEFDDQQTIQINVDNNKLITINDNNINNLEDLSIKSKTTCNYCNHKFTLKHNLNRHLKDRCEIKNKLLENKTKYDNIIALKNEEINKQKKLENEYSERFKEYKKETKKLKNSLKNYAIKNNNNLNIKMNNNVKLGPLSIEELLQMINDFD